MAKYFLLTLWKYFFPLPSVIWHFWLGSRKSIQHVKNWVSTPSLIPSINYWLMGWWNTPSINNWLMGCWCGYLPSANCRWFACGPADATATMSSLALLKFRMVLPFWYRFDHFVLEKRPVKWSGCSSSGSSRCGNIHWPLCFGGVCWSL